MQLTRSQVARSGVRPTRASRRVLVAKAAKTANGPRIAVVGITGAVGQEFLTVRVADGLDILLLPKPELAMRPFAGADGAQLSL